MCLINRKHCFVCRTRQALLWKGPFYGATNIAFIYLFFSYIVQWSFHVYLPFIFVVTCTGNKVNGIEVKECGEANAFCSATTLISQIFNKNSAKFLQPFPSHRREEKPSKCECLDTCATSTLKPHADSSHRHMATTRH